MHTPPEIFVRKEELHLFLIIYPLFSIFTISTMSKEETKKKEPKSNQIPPSYLESIGWENGWENNISLIKRVDDISKLTNGVVYVVVQKKATTKKNAWEIVKALAPPDFPFAMKGESWFQKLFDRKKKPTSKASRDAWYREPFFTLPKEENFEPTTKKPKL